jgi:hypothetical protein
LYRIAQRYFTPGNGIAAQYAGEGFTYRAQLKQGLRGDGFVRRNIGFTEGKVVRLTLINHRHRHTRNGLRFHQRRNGTFHHLSQLFF